MSETQTLTLPGFLAARLDEYERAIMEVTSTYFDAPMSEAEMWADLEAKRQMVGAVENDRGRHSDESRWMVLRLLASVYADHPDYREEWAL